MNRIISRAKATIALILVLACGMCFFCFEYFTKSGDWVLTSGSPHVYNAGNIGCGVITDRSGALILDLTGERTYSQLEDLRRSTIHWVGDRQGNISAPALSHYSSEILGHDLFNGVYAYGGTGGKVILTLSAQAQMAALDAMGDYKGTIAVFNYKTGEVLCAVSTPTFDPLTPPVLTDENMEQYEGIYLNRFIQSTYTPGSIFKIVTTAAALETIPDIQQRTFTCEGIVEYGIDTVTCEQAHGMLNLKDAFAKSCNCAFARIAGELGGKTLQQYAEQFGITSSLQFDGLTTAAGSLDAENAAAVQVAWSAIGQHRDLINPCSYMTFIGTIASGGTGVIPHFVSRITSGSKPTYEAAAVSTGTLMTQETAQILLQFMRNNVENYYGDDNFPGLTVCAKSGTAEVGGAKKPNAMFTGFVADEAYPLAFIVAIEDGGYGRPVCVPVLSQVLSACKTVLDMQ